MNCQVCQKVLEAYLDDRFPEMEKAGVEEHIRSCEVCAESLRIARLTHNVMEEEKSVQPDPFLVTRVMAGIEEVDTVMEVVPAYQRVLRPALIGISVAAAIFAGVFAGNFYNLGNEEVKVPVEMSYMDDAALESLSVYNN